MFWTECVCFVLTGEPDREEERREEQKGLEKVTDVEEREEEKLANSIACRQRWMRS